jgi:hypothetical protein
MMMSKFNYIILALFAIISIFSSAQNNVTFQVDMSDVDPSTFTIPEFNGDFNGWCGNCSSMSDADGDGIHFITVDLPLTAF